MASTCMQGTSTGSRPLTGWDHEVALCVCADQGGRRRRGARQDGGCAEGAPRAGCCGQVRCCQESCAAEAALLVRQTQPGRSLGCREKAELAAAAAAAAAGGTSAPEGAAALPAEGQPASSEPAPSALPGTQQPLPDSAAQELPTGPKVDSDAVIDSTAAMKAEALPAKAEEPEEPGGWSGWQ